MPLLFVFFLAQTLHAQVSLTVGPAGSYPTLTAAFAAINNGNHSGDIVISILSDVIENNSVVLNYSGLGPANYSSVRIVPSGGAFTISGAIVAGSPLIDLNGADNVTIDGLNDGLNALTIKNTTVSATAGTSTIRFIGGASYNTITRCAILGSATMSTATDGGTISFATDAITANGNDNNTVSYNNIGPSEANLPSKAISGIGTITTTALNNSSNIISRNNIYNYFSGTISSAGVYAGAGCTDWGISNNNFYQTAARTLTVTNGHSAIMINNTTSGNNFSITENTIGYNAANRSGKYTFVGASGASFVPVYIIAGSAMATNVENNLITAIAMSGSSSGNALTCIFVPQGRVDITGNTIGNASSVGSITYSSSSTFGSFITSIFNQSPVNNNISNNNIGGFTVGNTSTGYASFVGINNSTNSASTITGNTVGGVVANSIQSTTTATGTRVWGIFLSGTNGMGTVTGNNISNLTSAGGTGTNTSASVIGISLNTSGSNQTISQNLISNLKNTNSSAATVVTGIQFTGSTGGSLVSKNLIHSLSCASPVGTINGINISGGTATYQNNMISLGTGIATGCAINGINEPSSSTSFDNFYFNSIYVGGTGVSGSASTFAFNSLVINNTRNIRNNIFYNARSNGSGTGRHCAVQVGGSTINPAGLTINYNDYFANGTGGVFGRFGGIDRPNMASWQSAVGQDPNSVTGDPQYIASVNLHINAAVPTPVESAGITIAGITDDYDADLRAPAPDIGADEINGIPFSVPVINSVSKNPNAIQCIATDRTITANITAGSYNLTSVTLKYSYNGGVVTSVTMTGGTTAAGTTSDWTGIIPAATPPNATVSWSVTVSDGVSTKTTNGISYADAPIPDIVVTAVPNPVCPGDTVTLTVGIVPPIVPAAIAYCASTHVLGCVNDNISHVVLNTLNNNTGTTCGGTLHYTYFNGGGSQTTTLTAATVTYNLSVTLGADGNQYVGAWIDYNHDGVYSTAEFISAALSSMNVGINGTLIIPFMVPKSAYNGLTHLRIVGGNESPLSAPDACGPGSGSGSFGETQDYDISITGGTNIAPLPASVAVIWSINGGGVVGNTNPLVRYPTATSVYTATVTDSNGCSKSQDVTVTVLQATSATIIDTACSSFTLNDSVYTASGTYIQHLKNAAGCDSIITLNLEIQDSVSTVLYHTSCNGYYFNNTNLTQSGTYTKHFTTAAGCDSTVILHLTIIPQIRIRVYDTACGSYSFFNSVITSSGNYTKYLISAAGCDSIIDLNLTILNNVTTVSNDTTACDSLVYGGRTYFSTTTDSLRHIGANGCDSIVVLHVIIKNSTSYSIDTTVCDNFTLNAQTYTASGTYTQHLPNAAGCDSIIYLNLTIKPCNLTDTIITCDTAYTWHNVVYHASGVYEVHLVSASGGDSVRYLYLIVNATKTQCQSSLSLSTPMRWSQLTPPAFLIGGALPGAYTTATNGTWFHLYNPPTDSTHYFFKRTFYACTGGTYVFNFDVAADNNITVKVDNVSLITFPNLFYTNYTLPHNVTATVFLPKGKHEFVADVYNTLGPTGFVIGGTITGDCLSDTPCIKTCCTDTTIFDTTCQSFTLNSQVYIATGIYIQHLTNAAGCDSMITLHLTITTPVTTVVDTTACDSLVLEGHVRHTNGTDTLHYTTGNGCDSIVILRVTIYRSYHFITTDTVCASALPYRWRTVPYTASGVYTQPYTTTKGCDSSYILNLTVVPNPQVTISGNTVVCKDSCTTLTANGIANATYVWMPGGQTTQSITVCPAASTSYTVTAGVTLGANLISNGDFSNDYANFTVQSPYYTLFPPASPGHYAVTANPLSIAPYLQIPTDHTPSADNKMLVVDASVNSAKPFFWEQKPIAVQTGKTYRFTFWYALGLAPNPVIRATIKNASGSLQLAFKDIRPTSLTRGEWRQFYLDFTPTITPISISLRNLSIEADGNDFAIDDIELYKLSCSATASATIRLKYPTVRTLTATACDSFKFNGIKYYSSGTYTQHLTNAAGCDSTITLKLTINRATTIDIYDTTCSFPYIWNGLPCNGPGTYTRTLKTTKLCDSIVMLHLSGLSNVISSSGSTSICAGSCATLSVSGYPANTRYQWLPTGGNNSSATVCPSKSSRYKLVATYGGNELIPNGNFNSGATGWFASQYTFSSSNNTKRSGTYSVTSTPASVNNSWANMRDHTPTTTDNNMLLLDGDSLFPATYFWQLTVPVAQGGRYRLTYWVASIITPRFTPPVPVPTIASSIANTADLANPFSVSNFTPQYDTVWRQVSRDFTATSNSITITLRDINTDRGGNDFAIDDISLLRIFCTDTITFNVTVKRKPKVAISGSLILPCTGIGTTTLTASATLGAAVYNYKWYSGIAPFVSAVGMGSTIAAGPGIWSVVVTDAEGCKDTLTTTVLRDPCCAYSIQYASGACGNGLKFTIVGGAVAKVLEWKVDGAPITGVQNPKTITGYVGSRQVCATFAIIVDRKSVLCSKCVTVDFPPDSMCAFTADFCYTSKPFGNGAQLSFTNTTVVPPGITQTYLWDFGDFNTSTAANPVHNFPLAVGYKVCLTVTRTCGGRTCKVRCCKTIYMNSPCKITANTDFQYTVNYAATGTTIRLTAVSVSPLSKLVWKINGLVVSTATTFDYTPTAAGNYVVCLLDSISSDCKKLICHNIAVDDRCLTKADFSSTWCKSTPFKLDFTTIAPLPAGASLLWSFGDGTFSTVANPVHNFAGAGGFRTICLTVYTSANCTATTCYKVLVGTADCQVMLTSFSTPDEPQEALMAKVDTSAKSEMESEIRKVTFYPNPTTSQTFTIKTSYSLKDANIQVLDINGKTQQIQVRIKDGNSREIRFINAVRGFYFVQIISNGKRDVGKIEVL